jgi:hypothetical protein
MQLDDLLLVELLGREGVLKTPGLLLPLRPLRSRLLHWMAQPDGFAEPPQHW